MKSLPHLAPAFAGWLDQLLAQRWLLELLAAAAGAEAASPRSRFLPARCPLSRSVAHAAPSFRQENLPC